MKTPIDMLHDIATQISEGNTLLEMIYKNTDECDEKTDSAIACLIRSLDKTRETAYVYIEELMKNEVSVSPPPSGNSFDIEDDVSDALLYAGKTREAASVYIDSYFSDKDNDDPKLLMASIIFDYAVKAHETLKNTEAKLS